MAERGSDRRGDRDPASYVRSRWMIAPTCSPGSIEYRAMQRFDDVLGQRWSLVLDETHYALRIDDRHYALRIQAVEGAGDMTNDHELRSMQ